MIQLPKNDWSTILKPVVDTPEIKTLFATVDDMYDTQDILPKRPLLFNALDQTPFANVKVVILGQDPYPNPTFPVGLSFSVADGVRVPISLQNIFKERLDDVNIPVSTNGNLTKWAKQGVLLLNTTLTVEAGNSNSHRDLGWSTFTDAIVQSLNAKETPIVFILWGNAAKAYKPMIGPQHFVIESSHPSGFSARRGFFGSKPFSRTNTYLVQSNQAPINWCN